MKTFTHTELNDLAKDRGGWCVSIYMPTHPACPEGQQDPVRLKNLLVTAESSLLEQGVNPTVVRKMLRESYDLLEDNNFWNQRSAGLAIFLSEREQLRHRLPVAVSEEVVVDRRFRIRQLLPLLYEDDQVYVLALSRNKVRLLSSTQYEFEPVELACLPVNMDEALNLDGADRGEQTHAAMRGSLGKQAAVFHGQGGRVDTLKADIEQFFRIVSSAIEEYLRGSSAPLVLAGVDYEVSMFRSVCKYPHVAGATVTGNFDHASDFELHNQARPVIESIIRKPAQEAVVLFDSLTDRSRAVSDLVAVLPASRQGKVDTLLIDSTAQVKGSFDAQTDRLDRSPESGNDDLLELAAVQTLRSGGKVYYLPASAMPGHALAAAILRY